MQALDLRLPGGAKELAARVVGDFFALFSKTRLAEARALTTPGFVWFGDADLDWQSPGLAAALTAEPLAAADARCLSPELVDALPEPGRTQAIGLLAQGDWVVLIDVTRGAETCTAAAVVAHKAGVARLKSVFDPTELRQLLMRLVALAEGAQRP